MKGCGKPLSGKLEDVAIIFTCGTECGNFIILCPECLKEKK